MAEEQTLDEILDRIQKLSPKDATVVAVRAAMRVLPILAQIGPLADGLPALTLNNEANWCSREGLIHLVFYTFRACQCASIINPDTNDVAYAAADLVTIVDAAYAPITDTNIAVTLTGRATAAAAAACAATVEDVASIAVNYAYDTADYAYEAALESGDIENFVPSLAFDLEILHRQNDLSTLPLWLSAGGMPKSFEASWRTLQTQMLYLDPSFKYWIRWYEARLGGKPLIWEAIRDQVILKKESRNQSPTAIMADLLALAQLDQVTVTVSDVVSTIGKEGSPLNRIRCIFIGPGFAGKTSLLHALHGELVLEGNEDMTMGIEIIESYFDNQKNHYRIVGESSEGPIVHFWDFGGQVMYHATHQFFLRSQCVYVLVLDVRRAAAGGSEADYWLEHVRAFAPGAPVLIVGNKADLGHMDWDQNRLRKKYSNIWPNGFYQLACTQLAEPNNRHRHDFARFKEDLQKALELVGIMQKKFLPGEFAVLEKLRQWSPCETFLPKEDYERLCEEQGLVSTDSYNPAAVLLDLLDILGVVIHFPNIPRLDEFLLNPRWLTYGVYQIINRNKPRVSEAEVFDCLSRSEITDNLGNPLAYPRSRCSFILDAMEQFKVAYRLNSSQGDPRFEIPSLLPTDEPKLDFPEDVARAFQFRFEGLLPPQLLPQLIVARHTDIDKRVGRHNAWRHGAMLRTQHNGGARALLRGDAYDRTLTLWIIGLGLDRYFAVLYQSVKDILATMPELSYEELIRLPTAARLDDGAGFGLMQDEAESWARWVNVLHASLRGQTVYSEGGIDYDMSKVLCIMSEQDRKGLKAELVKATGLIRIDKFYAGTTTMGDNNHFISSQIGAVGSNAKADNNTFQQIVFPTGTDYSTLADELANLRKVLRTEASEPEHDEALGEIAAAEKSARKGDGVGLLEHLKSAGGWAFDVATKIGTTIAAEAIKQAMGL